MNPKIASRLFKISLSAFAATAVTLVAVTLSWFTGPNVNTKDDDYLDGVIGLRNYFFDGDGSEGNPYEIVYPIHFYNLTRLQNLGIFPTKKHFQIGHAFQIDGQPKLRCIADYDENGDPIYTDYLDMEAFCQTNTIMTIGNEGTPFVGTFDGNGLPIKNLKVSGYPEDIGVFGYVAAEGSLQNLVFDNLEITSLGYNKDEGSSDNLLFSQDIDDIFSSASYLATEASLSFFKYDAGTDTYVESGLKHLNGATGTRYANINGDASLIDSTDIVKGYFKPTFPDTTGRPFTYSILSSSELIKADASIVLPGKSDGDFVIDLQSLKDSETFNGTNENVQRNAKIYLVASTTVDGHVFSRVIQSYTCEFYSNAHAYDDGECGLGIYCDYATTATDDPTDYNTHYHHGNNIGLIVGHVDGTMDHCYVYNGRFVFNDSSYNPIMSETDVALVGEVGKNVANALNPELGLVVHGDIGVMNFSKIYSMIRSDAVAGTSVYGGRRTPTGEANQVGYVSYKEFINADTIDNFADYLRYYDGKKEEYEFLAWSSDVSKVPNNVWSSFNVPSTVPNDFNSVDFLWNKVVQDEEDIDRGLGVFKIVSSKVDGAISGSYGAYMANALGGCRIVNGTPKTKVYFSTAEYDHTVANSVSEFTPLRATTLPSYSEVNSFGYPFSRDYNYCFELNLEDMAYASGNDYMYNTDSPFLTNYLSSKLRDKYGAMVQPGTSRFGFMFRSSENELLSSLSSYMPVKNPGSKSQFGTDASGNPVYYPANSIVFRIENERGANISVVGNNADISVYSYDPSTSSGSSTKLYTMKATGGGDKDSHRYFTYDVRTGATGTETVQIANDQKDGGALYGHIFFLPQGDYVLGSSSSAAANIYFLAVQGQNDGTIGNTGTIETENAIQNVDFLLEPPTYMDFHGSFNKAYFSFKGNFNLVPGTLTMAAITDSDKRYMRISFATSPTFVTYIMTYSRHPEHTYYINGDIYSSVNYVYTP